MMIFLFKKDVLPVKGKTDAMDADGAENVNEYPALQIPILSATRITKTIN